jgi:hypothetical protein
MRAKTIWEFENILKENATFEKVGEFAYKAFFLKGSFDGNFDYGRGILQVSIYLTIVGKNRYSGLVAITNIDDGVWQAVGVDVTNDLAKSLIIEVFEPMGGILPTEKELNEKLMQFGLWGEFTG